MLRLYPDRLLVGNMLRTTARHVRRNATLKASQRAPFSASTRRNDYDDTVQNLLIGENTRVIFQGFTGRQATANAKESIAWGTKIVGGVTPGKNGEHLGLPVLPSVREAMEKLKPDATGIYVAAHQAPGAIEEAIEAEVPLVVAVAEHIPIHDMMRIRSILKTQSKSRLVGANSPGIISSIGKCRIGFQPLPCFSPGRVGIIAKSGTLSYEAVASTTRAGLGQSLCIGMGGDTLAGTDFVDALKVFEHDDQTEGILVIGELGGFAELEAVEWIKDYKKRVSNPKPIVGLIGGVHAAPGRVSGHAGAFTVPGEPSAADKIKAFNAAGITTVNHPAKLGDAMKKLLGQSGRASTGASAAGVQQKRGMHTSARRIRPNPSATQANSNQKRSLWIRQDLAFDMLRKEGVNASDYSGSGHQRLLAVAVDRVAKSPAILASPATDPTQLHAEAKFFPFDYQKGFDPAQAPEIAKHLQLSEKSSEFLPGLIQKLVKMYMEKEAFLLETKVVERLGELKVTAARFGFDDAAFRSNKRQADVHALRKVEDEVPEEVEAEKDGIVYIKLAGNGNIGTLVNGAGLAMNTVDALADAGGKAANFLDTGGKATSETVKKSFQAILSDERVKTIFVNIFGGLTLGDMIANGVILAFKELDMKVPVVVRIRGTNEKEGQKIIAESGLPLHAYDDFEEACAKVIELSKQ